MASARGGRRAGPSREKYAPRVNAAEKRIAERLPELIDGLFELALGVEVQKSLRDGQEKVYSQPPDFRAAAYLLDRILGKPVSSAEPEAPGGEGLSIQVVYADGDADAAEAASGAAGGAA